MNRTKITKIVMRWLKTARPDNSDAPSDLVDAICSEVAKMNPATVWPEKKVTTVVCDYWIRKEPCHGWNTAIDACKAAVEQVKEQ